MMRASAPATRGRCAATWPSRTASHRTGQLRAMLRASVLVGGGDVPVDRSAVHENQRRRSTTPAKAVAADVLYTHAVPPAAEHVVGGDIMNLELRRQLHRALRDTGGVKDHPARRLIPDRTIQLSPDPADLINVDGLKRRPMIRKVHPLVGGAHRVLRNRE